MNRYFTFLYFYLPERQRYDDVTNHADRIDLERYAIAAEESIMEKPRVQHAHMCPGCQRYIACFGVCPNLVERVNDRGTGSSVIGIPKPCAKCLSAMDRAYGAAR